MNSLDNFIYLGVNIDHVATLRQARRINYPDPLQAALIAEQAGADLITVHLREDRRHIQDQDVISLKQHIKTRLNLEIAAENSMLDFAVTHKPEQCCLVPEKREEITTEGGLDIIKNYAKIKQAVARLQQAGIRVSLFIDHDLDQIKAAADCGADDIEIHTGSYAAALLHSKDQFKLLEEIKTAVNVGLKLGLRINAGHGLHYHNVQALAAIEGISELNIGHAIIARAVITGLTEAVATMKNLMTQARVKLG
jgi:pyridoxine 5-phosphate synthase